MRRRLSFGAVAVVVGTAACTSLLGDFSVTDRVNPGADGDGGNDARNGSDGNPVLDGAVAGFTLKKPAPVSIIRGTAASVEVDVVRTACDADIALTIVGEDRRGRAADDDDQPDQGSHGSIDVAFGGSGVKALSDAQAEAVVVESNGDVVVGGTDTANARVRRYGLDGTDDTAFDTTVAATLPGGVDLIADSGTVDYVNGAPSSSEWHAAAVTPGGRIVLAGVDDAGWIVARYWP